MIANAITNRGLVRKKNEDSFLVDKRRGLFMVADGMGGHKGGEVASKMAIELIDRMFNIQNNTKDYEQLLKEVIEKANYRIYEESQMRSDCSDMGTTLTTTFINKDSLLIAHIGDSRVYLIRDKKIYQLTEDHSLVGELLRNGEITSEMAQKHPHRNILTRALGTESKVEIDMQNYKLKQGDLLLLCTDGLTNLVNEKEILQVISKKEGNLERSTKELVNLALERGGNDNITVILVCYDGN